MSVTANSVAGVDENVRRAFEAAWRQGPAPAIEEHLVAVAEGLRLGTLEELVQIDIEMRWKARERASREPVTREPLLGSLSGADKSTVELPAALEAYLERFPELRRPDILLRLIKQEFRVRRSWGDQPTSEDYLRRFPLALSSQTLIEATFPGGPTPPAALRGPGALTPRQ